VVGSFRWVFGGGVAGENGQYAEAVRYAPHGLLTLVQKNPGELGEGLVYLGLPVVVLALAGAVVVVARRRGREAAYAALALPVLFFTFGPAADRALARALDAVGLPGGGADPYRRIFDLVPFFQLQRVSARLLVLAALLLILLAVVAIDTTAGWLLDSGRAAMRWRLRAVAAIGAVALMLGTVWVLSDYRIFRTVLRPAYTQNEVLNTLEAAGDHAGPFLGLPVLGQTYPWNAASTYLASQTGRRTLNAYNQSSTSWLNARAAALAPLNQGRVNPAALAALRATGTHQVVVINESHVYCCGRDWHVVVDRLVGSGHFRLVVDDAPFALLELQP